MKSAVSAVLLLFVGVSLVYLVIGGHGADSEGGATDDAGTTDVSIAASSGAVSTADAAQPDSVGTPLVVYYFHGDFRCKTCLAMERYAKEAVEQTFADPIKEGRVVWRAVNFNKPENEHYIETYDLSASAVVVAEEADGRPVRSRNLGLIWDLVDDEFAYKAYIVSEVEEMLEEGS